MYGNSIYNLLDKSKPFSLDEAINQINNLDLEDYDKYEYKFGNWQEFLHLIDEMSIEK